MVSPPDKRYTVPVLVTVFARNRREAWVELYKRMGVEDIDWDHTHEIFHDGKLVEDDPPLEHAKEMFDRPDLLDESLDMNRPSDLPDAVKLVTQLRVENCTRVPCCGGVVQYRHKNICQLEETEKQELLGHVTVMMNQLRQLGAMSIMRNLLGMNKKKEKLDEGPKKLGKG